MRLSTQPAEQHIFISDLIMQEHFRRFCSSAAERMPYKGVIWVRLLAELPL